MLLLWQPVLGTPAGLDSNWRLSTDSVYVNVVEVTGFELIQFLFELSQHF